MKNINPSLVLTLFIAGVLILMFLWLNQQCKKIKEDQVKLHRLQQDAVNPDHVPMLVDKSASFQDALLRFQNLENQFLAMKEEMDLLFSENETLKKQCSIKEPLLEKQRETLRPSSEDWNVNTNLDEQEKRYKDKMKKSLSLKSL